MRLKSINHQSNSLGSLTHELKGRTRGGKCQDSFQITLSTSCSGCDGYTGSLPTKVLFFLSFWGMRVCGGGCFVYVVWYLRASSFHLESVFISGVEEATLDTCKWRQGEAFQRHLKKVCLSKQRLFPSLLTVCFFFFSPPGGLFHWNAQDLQRVNKSDRPGRADRWTEEEGDGGQAQRIACSVHCRWWLREESRKTGREKLLSCPAEWIGLYWGSFRLEVSDGQNLIVISFSLTPHQPFLKLFRLTS